LILRTFGVSFPWGEDTHSGRTTLYIVTVPLRTNNQHKGADCLLAASPATGQFFMPLFLPLTVFHSLSLPPSGINGRGATENISCLKCAEFETLIDDAQSNANSNAGRFKFNYYTRVKFQFYLRNSTNGHFNVLGLVWSRISKQSVSCCCIFLVCELPPQRTVESLSFLDLFLDHRVIGLLSI
jgi:hypothetical protein